VKVASEESLQSVPQEATQETKEMRIICTSQKSFAFGFYSEIIARRWVNEGVSQATQAQRKSGTLKDENFSSQKPTIIIKDE
jgi:hypothetical protein